MAAQFDITNWTLIMRAADSQSPDGRQSLERLCRDYWPPLYAYARGFGMSHEDAEDVTQAFFLKLLDEKLHAGAHPSRGRFRTYLLVTLKNFMMNEHRRDTRLKRGGTDREMVPVEDAETELINDATPARAYERKWAHTVLAQAMERLRKDCEEQGNAQRFTVLQPLLFDSARGEGAEEAHAALLGISTGAAKVALTRLRQRYRELLRLEVTRLVHDPADVDEELAHLMQTLAG